MCLDRGARPTLSEFESRVHNRNYDHLCIWQSVGRDVDNGEYAIQGARLGTWLTMLKDWDHRDVQDFDRLSALWDRYSEVSVPGITAQVTDELRTRLGLPMVELDADASRFFKHHYRSNFRNSGPMVRE